MGNAPRELTSPTWERVRNDPALAKALLLRAGVTDAIRAFFKERSFREVETPLLVRHPGMEPYLDVFSTSWANARGDARNGFLTTSPEYAMKKLLAAGIAPIFQICKSFRNGEDVSFRHNPEFTILEWYRTHADYTVIMDDCEALFQHVARSLDPASLGRRWRYGDTLIDLSSPWDRLTVRDAFSRYADVDVEATPDSFLRAAAEKGYPITSETTWEQAYHQIFLNEIEPRLGQSTPTILYEYPLSMAALSRVSPTRPRVAERFELYVAGMEMANAFSELTDAEEQRRRLREEQAERRRLAKTTYEIDADFLRALEVGIPPSAGIALGVDRLVMFFADVRSIREVLWFPADELFP